MKETSEKKVPEEVEVFLTEQRARGAGTFDALALMGEIVGLSCKTLANNYYCGRGFSPAQKKLIQIWNACNESQRLLFFGKK